MLSEKEIKANKQENIKKFIISLVACAIFGLAAILFFNMPKSPKVTKQETAKKTSLRVRLGDVVILPYMALTATAEDHNVFTQYAVAKDDIGVMNMLGDGRAFMVAEGTRGRVIRTKVFSIEVRVLDGKYQGHSGWIARELVKSP